MQLIILHKHGLFSTQCIAKCVILIGSIKLHTSVCQIEIHFLIYAFGKVRKQPRFELSYDVFEFRNWVLSEPQPPGTKN